MLNKQDKAHILYWSQRGGVEFQYVGKGEQRFWLCDHTSNTSNSCKSDLLIKGCILIYKRNPLQNPYLVLVHSFLAVSSLCFSPQLNGTNIQNWTSVGAILHGVNNPVGHLPTGWHIDNLYHHYQAMSPPMPCIWLMISYSIFIYLTEIDYQLPSSTISII